MANQYIKILTGTPADVEKALNKHLDEDWVIYENSTIIQLEPGKLCIMLRAHNRQVDMKFGRVTNG